MSLTYKLFGKPKTIDEFVAKLGSQGMTSADITIEGSGELYSMLGIPPSYKAIVKGGNTKITLCKAVGPLPGHLPLTEQWVLSGIYNKMLSAAEYLQNLGIEPTINRKSLEEFKSQHEKTKYLPL